jgi:hypothetical protein
MQALDINGQRAALSGWIYGPETGKPGSSSTPEVVPAITVSWSWAGERPHIQVVVALLIAGSTTQTGLNVTAFRFESADEGTPHSFHHAQPTARHVHRGDFLEGVRRPLHESVPAFPLDAVGPVGVIICVLLSLYGRDEIVTMLSHDAYLSMIVRPYLVELPAFYASYSDQPPASGAGSSATVLAEGVAKPRAQPAVSRRKKKRSK